MVASGGQLAAREQQGLARLRRTNGLAPAPNANEVSQDLGISLDGILSECLSTATVVVDDSARITLMSRSAVDLLGLDPNSNKPIEILPDPLSALAREALESGHSIEPTTISVPGRDENHLVISASACPIAGGSDIKGLILTIRTINPGVVEARFRHLERLARIGVLTAGLAHELRNALVAVNTFTDLLLEQGQAGDFVETVRKELDRANGIAEQMLQYSRPTRLHKVETSLHEVLNGVLRFARSRIKEANAELSVALEAARDTVLGTPAQLEQVFLNLLLNAIDSLEDRKQVTVRTQLEPVDGESPSMITVTIEDTGMGVPADHLPKLFQPFYTTKKHGTGLGLYLAQRVVREHSGVITMESTPGRGTTMRVTLPAHAEPS